MHPNDDILVTRTLCGDKSAFTLLMERYQGVVYRIAHQKVENHHDAEDIAQEAFLKAYCKLKTLKDRNTFPSWLYAITVNLCKSWWRKRKRQMETIELAEVAPLDPAIQFYERQEQKAVLWDSVNALAEKDRRIMTMFYREGYSTKEIGELMGITQNQVLVRLHRARKQLKEEFIMAHQTYAIGEVQLSFIEQVMERIHRMKPNFAPSNKPLAPWLATTTLVVIAMFVGLGVMQNPWFQSPYSLTGDESAVRIELMEAPIFRMPLPKQKTSKDTGNRSNVSALALANNSQEGENTEGTGWIQTNGPYGGRVSSLLATPDGTLYAGTGAGIFRSTDVGNSWTQSSTGLEDYGESLFAGVDSLVMIDGTLYAGGGDVFRSSDGGESWERVTQLRCKDVRALAVMGNTLYAGRNEEGIIRSTDGGEEWEPVITGLTNLRIRALTVVGTILYADTYDGVFRSTDGGEEWEPIKTQLAGMQQINSFAVIGNTFYMGTRGGLFRSKDKGNSLTRIGSELMSYVSALAVSNTILYAGAHTRTFAYDGIFRSTDGGDSWSEVNGTGLPNFGVYPLLAVDGTLYAGTSRGIFRLVEGEESWTEINHGLTNTTIHNLVFLGTTLYGIAYTGMEEYIVRTVDGGKSWTTVELPLTVTLTVSGSTLYAARISHGGGVFRLEEGENSWTKINSELETIRLLVVTGKTFYVCTESEGDGIFRLEAGDDSWTHLGLSDQRIKSLAVSGTNIYAGTGAGKIFRSVDGGNSWTQVNKGMESGSIRDVVFVGKTIYAETSNGVFRSTDDGDSWTPINNINLDRPVLSVSGTTLYAGTRLGNVFRLEKGSDSWEHVESMHRRIRSLAVSGNTLYAGTMYEGVFRISLER